MTKKAKREKTVLKKWVRIFLSFILCLFACISIFLILSGLYSEEEIETLYSYNTERNIDYKVYLYKNSFFEEEYLGEGKQYTTQLIDYIDINFDYVVNFSKLANLKTNYDIEATIIGEYENSNGKSELWKKRYVLLEDKNKNFSESANLMINENLKIKYSDYNRIVNNFKTNFKLAIDAYLNIKLNINYDGNIVSDNTAISGTDLLEINIPLSKSTINIETDYAEDNSDTVFSNLSELKNYTKLTIGLIIAMFDLVLFLVLYSRIFINRKSKYSKYLDKILRDYKEIIIESSTDIDYENKEILDIKNFDDIIDIEEELKSPIMFYERIKKRESWFVIINDNYIYRYILRAEELEK